MAVAFVAMSPPLNVCCPVHVFAFARFSPSVPVVVIGPPVRVPSVATFVTVPPDEDTMHEPFGI